MLAVSKDLIKDAPSIDDDGQIDASEQDALYQHYSGYLGARGRAGRKPARPGSETGRRLGAKGRERAGWDTGSGSGPGDDAITRSEERLNVGTEPVEAGRARLRKYVVTENVTQTVPVSHEEVRVEREPVTGADRDAGLSGEPIGEAEHEVTLRAERPVVEKEAVPVERVRLATESVTEDAEVSETVRKEQIDDVDVDKPWPYPVVLTADTWRRPPWWRPPPLFWARGVRGVGRLAQARRCTGLEPCLLGPGLLGHGRRRAELLLDLDLLLVVPAGQQFPPGRHGLDAAAADGHDDDPSGCGEHGVQHGVNDRGGDVQLVERGHHTQRDDDGCGRVGQQRGVRRPPKLFWISVLAPAAMAAAMITMRIATKTSGR